MMRLKTLYTDSWVNAKASIMDVMDIETTMLFMMAALLEEECLELVSVGDIMNSNKLLTKEMMIMVQIITMQQSGRGTRLDDMNKISPSELTTTFDPEAQPKIKILCFKITCGGSKNQVVRAEHPPTSCLSCSIGSKTTVITVKVEKETIMEEVMCCQCPTKCLVSKFLLSSSMVVVLSDHKILINVTKDETTLIKMIGLVILTEAMEVEVRTRIIGKIKAVISLNLEIDIRTRVPTEEADLTAEEETEARGTGTEMGTITGTGETQKKERICTKCM